MQYLTMANTFNRVPMPSIITIPSVTLSFQLMIKANMPIPTKNNNPIRNKKKIPFFSSILFMIVSQLPHCSCDVVWYQISYWQIQHLILEEGDNYCVRIHFLRHQLWTYLRVPLQQQGTIIQWSFMKQIRHMEGLLLILLCD